MASRDIKPTVNRDISGIHPEGEQSNPGTNPGGDIEETDLITDPGYFSHSL